jgi:hypothetical protein
VLELNRRRPAVFNALSDGTIYLGVANGFRGTPEGARYFPSWWRRWSTSGARHRHAHR